MIRAVASLAVVAAVAISALPSWGNSYARNNNTCSDFEYAKQWYNREPKNPNAQIGYGLCLILKGEDLKGMVLLRHLAKYQNNVKAAFTVARHLYTKGTFDFSSVDKDNLNEIIEAYLKVQLYIEWATNYPDGYSVYEDEAQMELNSSYMVPFTYHNKFIYGAKGTENEKLLASPSYKGERDLKTFPDYSQHTINSLNSVVKYGSECANLPKKRHFKPRKYSIYTTSCRILRDLAKTLIPLEEERLNLLHDKSCSDDLPQCAKYDELKTKMKSIIKSAFKEIDKVGA